jgi:transglutaminase/protease-like cytokinesis protein 3
MIKLSLLLVPLFFVQSGYCQHLDFVHIDFSHVDSIAVNYKTKGDLDPARIAKEITGGLNTDIEKFRVIFRWITENIAYDINLYKKIISHNAKARRYPLKTARWNKRFNKVYVRHTIKKRTTVCEGYSWLLETMCRSVGLSSVVITGYARGIHSVIGSTSKTGHAWNAVMINNKWYLSDPTWASGGVDTGLTEYIRSYDETYFLVDPGDLIANHFPKDAQWMLLLEKPSLSDFINAPVKTTGFLKTDSSVIRLFEERYRLSTILFSYFHLR